MKRSDSFSTVTAILYLIVTGANPSAETVSVASPLWPTVRIMVPHMPPSAVTVEGPISSASPSMEKCTGSCAKEAGVGKLLVGHYSSRIVDFEAYLQECKEIFPESVAVQDGDVFDF